LAKYSSTSISVGIIPRRPCGPGPRRTSRRQEGGVRRPLIIAHRGGRGLAPENTLAACARALRLGVDAIEIDVRLTADDEPVVLHDATLDRTTTGRGPIAALDAAAVGRLDATVGW